MKRILKYGLISLAVACFGCLLNWIVMQANGGMPVPGIFSCGKWVNLNEGTKFKFLADILPFNLSLGDYLMLASPVLFIILVSIKPIRSNRILCKS